MIRVLHVAEATIGGTRKHLVQIASGLDRGRFQVAVACAVERDPHFREDLDILERQGVQIVEIPMQREGSIVASAHDEQGGHPEPWQRLCDQVEAGAAAHECADRAWPANSGEQSGRPILRCGQQEPSRCLGVMEQLALGLVHAQAIFQVRGHMPAVGLGGAGGDPGRHHQRDVQLR